MMTSEQKENSEITPNFDQQEEEEMDIQNRNALLRCRTKIVKDLDVRLIIDSLIETKVIDINFYEQLKAQVNYIQTSPIVSRLTRNTNAKFIGTLEI